MKLLLDEQHSPRIAVQLGKQRYDVLTAAGHDESRNLDDENLLDDATRRGRAIVTENASDFVALAVRWAGEGRAHAGIILTHPAKFNRAASSYPGTLIAVLRDFLRDPPISGSSWVWWL